ncbi:MAG: ABC transporter permease [Pseudonocardiales bacterium]|nr:MAG: ABC transporter permease [Pseudonocardiales bacterium]
MSIFSETLAYLNDPANYTGTDGIPYRTVEHLAISGAAVGIGCAVALPIGLWLGHTGRGGGVTVLVSNVSRAIPTLALLTIFATISAIGFGNRATIIALAIFAIPPLLTNTYVGMRDVDPEVREAARGMGFSGWGLLTRVEVPLALPLIAAGFRTAAVQVVATATLAALVGGGGLGTIINDGFGQQNRGEIFAGGILVALLALLTELSLALVQRLVTPRSGREQRSARPVEAADVPESAAVA